MTCVSLTEATVGEVGSNELDMGADVGEVLSDDAEGFRKELASE